MNAQVKAAPECLRIVPTNLDEANAFVEKLHRHHKPVPGARFSIAVADGDVVHGVAIISRPTARMSDDGYTVEVTRCCTDGTRNACSMLYRAAWRAAREMGYRRLITYTLPEEGGASLRGAGFALIGERGGGSWSRENRPRVDTHPLQEKLKWEVAEKSACWTCLSDVGPFKRIYIHDYCVHCAADMRVEARREEADELREMEEVRS